MRNIIRTTLLGAIYLGSFCNASNSLTEEDYHQKIKAEQLLSGQELRRVELFVPAGQATYEAIYKHITTMPEAMTLTQAKAKYDVPPGATNPNAVSTGDYSEAIRTVLKGFRDWEQQLRIFFGDEYPGIEAKATVRTYNLHSRPYIPADLFDFESRNMSPVYPRRVPEKWGIEFTRYNEWLEKIVHVITAQNPQIPTRGLEQQASINDSKKVIEAHMMDVTVPLLQKVLQFEAHIMYMQNRMKTLLDLIHKLNWDLYIKFMKTDLDEAAVRKDKFDLCEKHQGFFGGLNELLLQLITYYKDCEYMVAKRLIDYQAVISNPEEAAKAKQRYLDVLEWWRSDQTTERLDMQVARDIEQLLYGGIHAFSLFLANEFYTDNQINYMLLYNELPPKNDG